MSSLQFWSENQVGGPYATVEESAQALRDRQRQFPTLLDLMPVNYPGKTVLDWGCGPGHDTLLMSQLGANVTYYDISKMALQITHERLVLHGLRAELGIVFRVESFDHIHCAGVLHHVEDPQELLEKLSRLLAPAGDTSLMVYDGTLSEESQSEVPITHWWTEDDIEEMAETAGLSSLYLGSYECSAEWRPNCWAACYRLTHR